MTIKIQGLLFFVLMLVNSSLFALPKCLWVSSYAPGYAWEDGIAKGINNILAGKCELKTFHMDSKNNKSTIFAKKQALKAKKLIENWQPDVVIASDDNASKYLVVPYFKNKKLPIVVCGINWSAKKYAFPYKNVTGMIEVLQIYPLIDKVKKTLSINSGSIFILAANNLSSKINIDNMTKHFNNAGFSIKYRLVDNFEQWQKAFIEAQQEDVIYIMNMEGATGWNKQKAIDFVSKYGKKLTIGDKKWFLPYTMIIYAKRPEEQGEWAGKVTLKILQGVSPAQIPMTTNKQWEQFINTDLIKKAGIQVKHQQLKHAIIN